MAFSFNFALSAFFRSMAFSLQTSLFAFFHETQDMTKLNRKITKQNTLKEKRKLLAQVALRTLCLALSNFLLASNSGCPPLL